MIGTPQLLLRGDIWALVHRHGGRGALEPLMQMYWPQTGCLHLTTMEGQTHTIGREVLQMYVWSYLLTLVPPTDYSIPTRAVILGKEVLTWAMALQRVAAEVDAGGPVSIAKPLQIDANGPEDEPSPLRARMTSIPGIEVAQPNLIDRVCRWLRHGGYIDQTCKWVGSDRKKAVCRAAWNVMYERRIIIVPTNTAPEVCRYLNTIFEGLEVSVSVCEKSYITAIGDKAEKSICNALEYS